MSFTYPQIISGVCAFVGDGSVGSVSFIFAKGCELPVISDGGMWIPAGGARPGGDGCSWRFLGDEDADVLLVDFIRLDGGSLSLAALHLLVFIIETCWGARRRAASDSCGATPGRWKMNLDEELFTNKSFGHFFVIFFYCQVLVAIWGCTITL